MSLSELTTIELDITGINDVVEVILPGPQGVVGPVGPVGPTGPAGSQGPAATIAVGTTTTGAAGSNAAVTNSGTSSAAVFNFTIPQGIQGIQGIQGPAGTVAAAGPGTAAAPSISFAADTNTGFWNPAADTIGLSTGGNSVSLVADAANVLAQQNGTNAQVFRLYNTYSSAGANYERLNLGNNAGTGHFAIWTQSAGTGTAKYLELGAAGAIRWRINVTGHLEAFTDNTYDIGTVAANRPRTGYFGTSVVAPQHQAGTGGVSWGATESGTQDVFLVREAANTLAMRNATNPQAFRLYNTYTDATNYERLEILGRGSDFMIWPIAGGTGSARALSIGTPVGGLALNIVTAGINRWAFQSTGYLATFADNSYDIGATASGRPRTIYAGTSVIAPQHQVGTGGVSWGATESGTQDVFLVREAANTLAQRNGANLQTFNLYQTYVDSSNHARLRLWGDSNYLYVQAQTTGTPGGAAARSLALEADSGREVVFRVAGTAYWQLAAAFLYPSTDNVTDLGSALRRVRIMYSQNLVASGAVATGGKAGIAGDADVLNPIDGMLRFDSTNNRLYVRIGATWRYATLT